MSGEQQHETDEIVHGGAVPLWGDMPPELQQMESTIRLPHGYSVTIRFGADGAPSFTWTPRYPAFKNPAEERRFWRRYYDARNRAMQDIATATRGVIIINGTDGLQVFEPDPASGGV